VAYRPVYVFVCAVRSAAANAQRRGRGKLSVLSAHVCPCMSVTCVDYLPLKKEESFIYRLIDDGRHVLPVCLYLCISVCLSTRLCLCMCVSSRSGSRYLPMDLLTTTVSTWSLTLSVLAHPSIHPSVSVGRSMVSCRRRVVDAVCRRNLEKWNTE